MNDIMIGFATRERSAGVKKAGEKRERQRGWLGFLPFGIVSGRRERYGAMPRAGWPRRAEKRRRLEWDPPMGSDRSDDRTRVDWSLSTSSFIIAPSRRS